MSDDEGMEREGRADKNREIEKDCPGHTFAFERPQTQFVLSYLDLTRLESTKTK